MSIWSRSADYIIFLRQSRKSGGIGSFCGLGSNCAQKQGAGHEAEHWAIAYQCTNSSSNMRALGQLHSSRAARASGNEGTRKVSCVTPVWAVSCMGKCSQWLFCAPEAGGWRPVCAPGQRSEIDAIVKASSSCLQPDVNISRSAKPAIQVSVETNKQATKAWTDLTNTFI
jgi:hypothetical protein